LQFAVFLLKNGKMRDFCPTKNKTCFIF